MYSRPTLSWPKWVDIAIACVKPRNLLALIDCRGLGLCGILQLACHSDVAVVQATPEPHPVSPKYHSCCSCRGGENLPAIRRCTLGHARRRDPATPKIASARAPAASLIDKLTRGPGRSESIFIVFPASCSATAPCLAGPTLKSDMTARTGNHVTTHLHRYMYCHVEYTAMYSLEYDPPSCATCWRNLPTGPHVA